MSELKVSVADQVLKITEAPIIASGGVNEVKVIFSFCEKWEGFIKTAIFYRDTQNYYYAVLDENDICVLPWEVCAEKGTFYFTVFGEKNGTRRTATIVRYKVGKGVDTENMMPSDPTGDVYSKLISMYEENKLSVEEVLARVAELENNIGSFEDTVKSHGDRLAASETWLTQSEERLTQSETRLSESEERLTATEQNVAYLNNYVTPQMFGAKGNGSADDTDAIQAAIDAGGGSRKKEVRIPKGEYRITRPLVISKANTEIFGESACIHYRAENSTGEDGATIINNDPAIRIECSNVILHLKLLWSENGNGTAVEIDGQQAKTASVSQLDIHVQRIQSFFTGVRLCANINPITYNKFRFDSIGAKSVGVLLRNVGSNMYISENHFYLGSVSGTFGILIDKCGENYFHDGSLEALKNVTFDVDRITDEVAEITGVDKSDSSTYAHPSAVYIKNGSLNTFHGFRTSEITSSAKAYLATLVGNCSRNILEFTTGNITNINISKLESGSGNVLRPVNGNLIDGDGYSVGHEANISASCGITHSLETETPYARRELSSDTYEDNIITHNSKGRYCANYICTASSTNGLIFKLSNAFYDGNSLLRGYPLAFHFRNGTNVGGFKLMDSEGQIIFDNTDFKYKTSVVVVRWTGRIDMGSGVYLNLWDVKQYTKPKVAKFTFNIYYGDVNSVVGTYTAVEGMSWAEWIDSEYNTDGLYVYDDGDHIMVYLPSSLIGFNIDVAFCTSPDDDGSLPFVGSVKLDHTISPDLYYGYR